MRNVMGEAREWWMVRAQTAIPDSPLKPPFMPTPLFFPDLFRISLTLQASDYLVCRQHHRAKAHNVCGPLSLSAQSVRCFWASHSRGNDLWASQWQSETALCMLEGTFSALITSQHCFCNSPPRLTFLFLARNVATGGFELQAL